MIMLRFISEYEDVPVMSLRGGRRISSTLEPIINPHKLRIEGFYCEDRASGIDKVLLIEDVREFSDVGLIVDSEDNLMEPADLVRLEEILDMHYTVHGKRLVTESGKKLGHVEDFAIDDGSFRIEKIYARPNALKTFSSNDYIINRRQIASVNMEQVIVKDAVVKRGEKSRRPSLNPLGS